ncbi:MAG: hypothetical protein ACRDIC_12430, partial [bacterium]
MWFEWQPRTPLEFVGFFVVLWCTVSFFLATLGGWRRLAEAYRSNGSFEGQRWRFRSARMRWGVNYGNCLTFGANTSGLTFRTSPARYPSPKLGARSGAAPIDARGHSEEAQHLALQR